MQTLKDVKQAAKRLGLHTTGAHEVTVRFRVRSDSPAEAQRKIEGGLRMGFPEPYWPRDSRRITRIRPS